MATERLISAIAEAMDAKKGEDIRVIDLSGMDGMVCSAFVICTAESTARAAAIADEIAYRTDTDLDETPRRTEGMQNATWIAMDYTDVIVHIFIPEAREFYRLDDLWADAPVRYIKSSEE